MNRMTYDPSTFVIVGHCSDLPIYQIRQIDPSAAITIQKNGFLITATTEPRMLEILLLICRTQNDPSTSWYTTFDDYRFNPLSQV